VTTPKRVGAAPEVPTMIESGLPGFEIVLYSGILAPKGMDRALVRRLNAEFAKAVQSAEMQPVWQNIGVDPLAMSPEEFEKRFFQSVRPTSILKRFIEPIEIAHSVAFLLSDHSTAITGTAFIVDGGVLAGA